MAFVESQQDNRWKREPNFDRRDVTVMTQNALCDTYYANYIRDQFDPRYRPKQWTPFEKWLGRDQAYPKEPITCVSDKELIDCWEEYQERPDVMARLGSGGPVTRPGTGDVFDINGIVAQKIFEKNKKDHTFYIEQSSPITWMYPYLLPSGLIFKLNPEPMTDVDFLARGVLAEDHKFWDAYSKKLLSDPRFRIDSDATLNFSKLVYWHSDLYRWRHLDQEQEYWLRLSLRLCPQLEQAVVSLAHYLSDHHRYDEAITVIQQAEQDDPRNEAYNPLLDELLKERVYYNREQELRAALAKSPSDMQLNLDFARLLQQEGRFQELEDRLRVVAGMNNWSHDAMAGIIQYYVNEAHNPQAAIAFLESRAKIDPKASELIYTLAALHATLGHKEEALHYLGQSLATGGTNAMISAKIDPRFAILSDDPRFQALLGLPTTSSPATNPPGGALPKPAKK
jgi:tetratricopeptide (TPR) repeat protein